MHFLGEKERVVIYRTDEKQASGRADGSEGRAAEVGGWVHSRCYPPAYRSALLDGDLPLCSADKHNH